MWGRKQTTMTFPADLPITKRDADLGRILVHYLQGQLWLILPRDGYKPPVWGEPRQPDPQTALSAADDNVILNAAGIAYLETRTVGGSCTGRIREEQALVIAFAAARRAIAEYKKAAEGSEHGDTYGNAVEALETLLDLPKMKRALEVASLYLTDSRR